LRSNWETAFANALGIAGRKHFDRRLRIRKVKPALLFFVFRAADAGEN
jgi:hypothetical protein